MSITQQRKKTKTLFFAYILPLLAWMGLIYYSTSQSYSDQNVQPVIKDFPLDWVERWFSWVSFRYGESVVSLETKTPEGLIEFFIRKGAHVFVFAVLGILAFRVLHQFFQTKRVSVIFAWMFVIVYAAIDEFRQSLHPDRTGMPEDVALDSVGGLLGITLFIIGLSIYQRKGKATTS